MYMILLSVRFNGSNYPYCIFLRSNLMNLRPWKVQVSRGTRTLVYLNVSSLFSLRIFNPDVKSINVLFTNTDIMIRRDYPCREIHYLYLNQI
jgi:hypothetical protein